MRWFRKSLFRKLLIITGGGTALLLASALTGLWWVHADLAQVRAAMHQEVTALASLPVRGTRLRATRGPAQTGGNPQGANAVRLADWRAMATSMDGTVVWADRQIVEFPYFVFPPKLDSD